MTDPATKSAAPPAEGLPVHLPTILRGLWRRRALPIVLTAVAVIVGAVVALGFGERRYAAETVLQYAPAISLGEATSSAQSVLNFVKMPSTLEGTRQRLKEAISLPALASGYTVTSQKGTDLIVIRAVAQDARKAADRANALREAFVENHAKLQLEKGMKQVRLVERNLGELNTALAAADQQLIDLGKSAGIVDLEKQTGSYLQHQMSVDLLYQQALADRTAVDEQGNSLEKAVSDLQKRIAQEQKAGPQEDLSSLNIRIGRLRSSIDEDRKTRSAHAVLTQKELELERAEKLAKEGLLSRSELDRVRADYEAQRANTVDTDQIQQWKADLQRLDKGVIPTKANDTPSSSILREVMIRRLDLDLEKVAVAEKVKQLDSARTDADAKVSQLPELQRQVNGLKRHVEGLELEKRSLEDLLAKAKAAAGSSEADFTVVAVATPPVFPIQSSRYPLLIAVVAFGLLLGLGLIVADEARDLTVRSGAEVPLKLGVRTLAVLPKLPPSLAGLPDGSETPLLEPFRRLTRQIRRSLPERGVRLLVVSATPGEGATLVAAHLAATFGRQDERVLLLDAALRSRDVPSLAAHAIGEDPLEGGFLLPASVEARLAAETRRRGTQARDGLVRIGEKLEPRVPASLRTKAHRLRPRLASLARGSAASARAAAAFLRRLLPALDPAPAAGLELWTLAPDETTGLASVLSYEAENLDEVTRPTDLVGVDCVSRAGRAPIPDLIASNRMSQMLDEASERFSVLVVDASPALATADAEILAPQMDAVIFVVRSQGPPASVVKQALARIAATDVPILGVVLNRVDKLYLPCSGEAVV